LGSLLCGQYVRPKRQDQADNFADPYYIAERFVRISVPDHGPVYLLRLPKCLTKAPDLIHSETILKDYPANENYLGRRQLLIPVVFICSLVSLQLILMIPFKSLLITEK